MRYELQLLLTFAILLPMQLCAIHEFVPAQFQVAALTLLVAALAFAAGLVSGRLAFSEKPSAGTDADVGVERNVRERGESAGRIDQCKREGSGHGE